LITPYLRRVKKKEDTIIYFYHTRYILKIDIKGFFDNISHDYLLNNYPFPKKFKHIIQGWLKSPIHYKGMVEESLTGVPQGSVIGPSLANFSLNGLEDVIKPEQVTCFSKEKYQFFLNRGLTYKPGQSHVRKAIVNKIIRYADDFIIICNEESQIEKVEAKVNTFLSRRGLESKILYVKWVSGAHFNFLGFTFHYINDPRPSRITEQRIKSIQKIRGGLYVYPSNGSTTKFKKKIKLILANNLNWSPYRMISYLNPVIRGWGNYFGVGTLRAFSRMDHYIFIRTLRYIRRKFKKVNVSDLVQRYYQGVSNPSNRT
jgi:RNA-directed DNA polymerase